MQRVRPCVEADFCDKIAEKTGPEDRDVNRQWPTLLDLVSIAFRGLNKLAHLSSLSYTLALVLPQKEIGNHDQRADEGV